MTQPTTIPEELQGIAAQGCKLFPVRPRGKEPLIAGWPEQASNDPTTLASWTAQYPNCNWGLATGPDSGRCVLDLDGTSGERWKEQQIERHGLDWLATPQVATARGIHLHYAWPAQPIRNSAKKVAVGVDIRGWRGYVVIPPSIHESGAAYEWRTDPAQRLAPVPAWLLELIQESQPSETSKTGGNRKRTIPAGQRNSSLTSLAGTMQRRGMSEESIRAALVTENSTVCTPPLDQAEVENIVASVSRYQPEPKLILPAILPRPLSAESTADLFETAAAYSSTAPLSTRWIAFPWIADRSLVELSGKAKCGKTSFIMALVASVLNGRPFLGETTDKTSVVFLTEQGESLRQSLARASLTDRNDLHLLRWPKVTGMSWPSIAENALRKCEQAQSRLLVIDTAATFLQLVGDSENSAGAAIEAVRPLQDGLEKGISTVLIRHSRKADVEDVVDSARGSSAFAAMMDTIMRLRRMGSTHPPTYRRLEVLSRFDEASDCILEWRGDSYQRHDVAAVKQAEADSKLLAALPTTEAEAKTCLELATMTKTARRTLERSLAALVTADRVVRVGAGIRGCAFRYYKSSGEEQIQ